MSTSTSPSAYGVGYDVGSDGVLRQEVVLKPPGGAADAATGEAHIGEVSTPTNVLDVTLSVDTSIYADGDVLAEVQAVTNFFRVADARAVLESLVVIDEDDQGVAFDLLFFDAAVSLGTENSAPSISDADMRSFLGRVSISAGDYVDWGGVRTVTKAGIGLVLKAASTTRTLYVGAVTRGGTPTYTASGLKLRLGTL